MRWEGSALRGLWAVALGVACLSQSPHYSARVIALIDYGSGNLRSVHKALLKVGAEVRIARQPGGNGRRAGGGAAGRRRV